MTNETIMASAAAINAINTFFFHAMNFTSTEYVHRFTGETIYIPTFIAKSNWACNVEHMIDKWNNAYNVAGCYGAMNKFYGELDSSNRIALINWVLENYHDCRDLISE